MSKRASIGPPRKAFPKLSIVSCYFPSGSSGELRQQAKFRFLELMAPYLQALAAEREVIVVGDINIAHKEIDLKNWRGNRKNSGFLPERARLDDAALRRARLRRPCSAP